MHVCCNVCQIHRTILRATVILLPLLGLTWLFGLLTLNKNATVFAWLFTIFNSLQVTTHTLAHQSCHENSHVNLSLCRQTHVMYILGLYLLGGSFSPNTSAFTPNISASPKSGCFIPKHPMLSLSACTQTFTCCSASTPN